MHERLRCDELRVKKTRGGADLLQGEVRKGGRELLPEVPGPVFHFILIPALKLSIPGTLFWLLKSQFGLETFRVLNRESRCFDSDSLNRKHFKKVFHFYLVWKLGLQKISAQFWQTFYRMVWKKISRNPCKNQAVRYRTAIFQFILTPNKGTRNCKDKLP